LIIEAIIAGEREPEQFLKLRAQGGQSRQTDDTEIPTGKLA